ncbi:MAG TPA: hypothetical protein VGC55_15030 [Dokdonella sp.]
MTTSGLGNGADAQPADANPPAEPVLLPLLPPAPAEEEFDRLRALLFGDELRAAAAARARLAEVERLQRALPDRLLGALEATAASPRVAHALARPVAYALGAAVRENRQVVVDTLFPVIGPLIRKSIAEALRNLMADLNGAIESSFTLRGLKWRLEAWRGGVPYAQIVLKHRLAYRIDHVFLIARESGLVLRHESAPDLPALDADAIGGMLTAIGDFVGDSVGQAGGSALDSAQVGEYLVWVVQGPRVNLACFIRGVPPGGLRDLLQQRLEEIHAQLDDVRLEQAPHDAALAATWHETLQPLALVQAAGIDEGRAARQRGPSRWPLLLLLLLALAALTAFFAQRERWDERIDALRARLQAQPGFVLTGLDAEPWRKVTVRGLVDPDAESLRGILDRADLGEAKVEVAGTGYLSTDDAVVVRRVRRLLALPAGVDSSVHEGVLELKGKAPEAWIAEARQRAAWIAGVRRVAMTVVPDADPASTARAELATLADTLKALQVPFSNDATLAADGGPVVDDVVAAAKRAQTLADAAHARISFTSVGSNDEVGTDDANQRVRSERARWLADALAARGIGGGDHPIALGEDAPNNRRAAYLRLDVEASP